MPEPSPPRRAVLRAVAAKPAPAREAVISVRGLVKQYESVRAVDGIGFDVFRGEVFAFLGPNGAGKTTTCEILETLRAKTAGEVRVLGMDVAQESESIRARIGVLPQDFNAYDRLTCRENLAYFAAMFHAKPDLDELLALVSLQDKADERYETLSGGLKQRLGVAIALVNDPELVFLDEPTTGLDPRARREAWEVVRGLRARGKTVFLTTHYMEEAQVLADRVAILNHGKIAAFDTPQRLIQQYAPGQTIVVRGAKLTLPGLRTEQQGADTVVHAADTKELSNALLALAKAGGYTSLEVRTPTLEDVFLRLTGETLEQAMPAAQPAAPKRGRRAA